MKTRAATLVEKHHPWEVEELLLDGPRTGEVLVRWDFSGLCFSDEHAREGMAPTWPMVGGHEGAGVVLEVGQGVTRLAPGDHVVASFIPVCGRCYWCQSGRSVQCENTAQSGAGRLPDGTLRFRGPRGEYANFAGVATFADHAVVAEGSAVRIDPSIPLDLGALASCGVLTGWGAAVRAGKVQVGETVAVVGAGGIGINAVIGAAQGGAANVIAVDPLASKRDFALSIGATHAAADATAAQQLAADLNPRAGGADLAIVAAGTLNADVVRDAFDIAGKRGRVVIASMTGENDELRLPGMSWIGAEKRVIGTLYGSCNPHTDIPLVLDLAVRGRLPLDRLISRRYPLTDIAAGYGDLASGRNIRGVIDHSA